MRPISLLFSPLRVVPLVPRCDEGGVEERRIELVAEGGADVTAGEAGRLRTGGLCSVGR